MNTVRTAHYHLDWKDTGDTWVLEFLVVKNYNHTKYLKKTLPVLEKELPSILQCYCDNPDKLPFSIEVQQTETGHLLEHILLEFLCKEKLQAGEKFAEFEGRTYYSIQEKDPGEFHIHINKTATDTPFFIPALKKSLEVLQHIFESDLPTEGVVAPSVANVTARK